MMLKLSVEPAEIEVGVRTPAVLWLINQSAGELSQVRLSFRLPAGLELLRGQTSLMVQRLAAGEALPVRLVVQARSTGRLAPEQVNLSFRDPQGRPHRYQGDVPGWVARMPAPQPRPVPARPAQLEVSFALPALRAETWAVAEVAISNLGPGPAREVQLILSDPRFQMRANEPQSILPGEQKTWLLNVKPLEAGELSLTWRVHYRLEDGTAQEQPLPLVVRVKEAERTPSGILHVEHMGPRIEGDGVIIVRESAVGASGRAVLDRCPACGAAVRPNDRFCEQCGREL